MAFIENLNENQRQAVLYNAGPHLVIAGAGSGKTRVLTYKIAYLLDQGISASQILALTFTNKAAREMKERIGQLVGEHNARYLCMGTFHSIFARILRQEAEYIGYTRDFTIYDTTDSKSLIKGIIKEMELDEKIYKVGAVLGYISEAKNLLQTPHDYANNRDYTRRDKEHRMYRLYDIYYTYQSRLKAANAMDFDDLLMNTNLLLESQPQVREKYQDLFRYILVDEYQDTNFSQYCIIRMLAAKWRNICVVGDDAQSIYSFRGADIRNILQFQSEYEGAPVFKLERNYRSTKNIVGAANSLIAHNHNRIHKDVYSENAEGQPIHLSSHGNDRDEALFISKQLERIHNLQSRSYDDMAVLYRTNAQSRVIEDELRKLGIPYRIYGSVSFYQRKEIKDVLAYFRLATNPRDDEALLRIINYPKRNIGDTTQEKLKETAHRQQISLLEAASHPAEYGVPVSPAVQKRLVAFAALILKISDEITHVDAYTFAEMVLRETGIRTDLMMDKTQEGIDRNENVQELLNALREFIEREGEVSITDFLSEVSLLTDQDETGSDDCPRVTLMTIHAAKGLEYGAVFIAGLEENLFPSMYCETPKELEEERRLLYVAITRAKELCYITSAKTRFRNGQTQFQNPSRFLKELDRRYVETGYEEPVRRPSWESPDAFETFTPVHRPGSLKATTGMQVKSERQPLEQNPFPIGSRVHHAIFGDGTVQDAFLENGNEKAVILFDMAGPKTMLLKFAKLQGLSH